MKNIGYEYVYGAMKPTSEQDEWQRGANGWTGGGNGHCPRKPMSGRLHEPVSDR